MEKLRIIGAVLVLLVAVPLTGNAQETSAEAVAEAVRLRNASDFTASIAILKAHLRAFPNDGQAIRLLAQTQYWAKDFSGARQTYERAVRLHPEDSALRQQYEQFLTETTLPRGWVKLVPAFHHDDQPLDRFDLNGEAGWYLQRDISLALNLSTNQFRLSDTASRSVSSAMLSFAQTSAQSGLTLALSAGLLRRSFDTEADFIGAAAAGFRLSPTLRVRGQFERAPYLYTEASLSTAVMTNTESAFLTLNSATNWLGEVSVQLQQYPDDNALTTAYAWLLAPVSKSASHTMHIGYSAAYQNASELRFQLEQTSQSASPSSNAFNFAGRYSPYYTPLKLQTHSVIAALAGGLNTSAVFRVSGGYAVLGTEDAPHFVPVSLTAPPRTEARLTTISRNTHPWNARATLELNNSGSSPILLGVETAQTAFYSSLGAFAYWTLKF